MSEPRLPEKVRLIASLFSPEKETVDRVIDRLAEQYGPIERTSPDMFFDRTRYYAREMGWPLHRRFISFEELILPETLVDVKLNTNAMENAFLVDGKRRINIDPGMISAERLILATGKNYIHRVYLSNGIYADLTLLFKRGGFQPLEWTYRDYAEPDMIRFFNELRQTYMEKLKELKRID